MTHFRFLQLPHSVNFFLPIWANLPSFISVLSLLNWKCMNRTMTLSTVSKGSGKIKNYLWIYRKRMGLAQKQAAFLLGHKNTAQLSRYEKGRRIPSLVTALKLEIIYATPVRALFPKLCNELKEDIQKRQEILYKALKNQGD